MSSNHLYYHLKPYLPWRLRIAVRRMVAKRRRLASKDVWPINEAAGKPPEGWPGWPDGKKFAFVLTHDVEGPAGLAKCRQLMQVEKELGFRSSFNFIPEGDYAVSRGLREELMSNGFEVGVQDLKHDGLLFRSRESFRRGAVQINRYLREWGAVGFRSGFMFHNLEWAHDLDVEYSSCTFDTDPFEPQPDGVGTIFPFWVTRGGQSGKQKVETRNGLQQSNFSSQLSEIQLSGKKGYVELPYTLPQDSTLFLLLQEETHDIWIQKLDWIAAHGGMVLLNTHPDYMAFNGAALKATEYPLDLYRRFLRQIQTRYATTHWNALPKEIAAYVVQSRESAADQLVSGMFLPIREPALVPEIVSASQPNDAPVFGGLAGILPGAQPDILPAVPAQKAGTVRPGIQAGQPTCLQRRFIGRRAAVLLFSEFPSDPRPCRAAEALAQEGMIIDVICLQGNPDEPRKETMGGINIWRVPLKRSRGGKLTYAWRYSAFILVSLALLGLRSIFRRYHLVHVHNMPDVLVFGALVPKLFGAKVILDLHDPMPELMMTIFGLCPNSFVIRTLKRNEKWSTAFADLVLTVNEASKGIYSSRSCPPEKIRVIMNSPDEQTFVFRPVDEAALADSGRGGTFRIMYHGSLLERNGFDIAVDALEEIRRSIPGATMVVCGQSTPFFERVMQSVRNSGMQDAVQYLGRQDRKGIAKAIDNCDIGIIPNRRNLFTEMNTPTRIFEYLSRGKPVIAPRARGVLDYFGENEILFFELGNARDLAAQLHYAFSHRAEVESFVRRGQRVYLAHRWSQEKSVFLGAVELLLQARAARASDLKPLPISSPESSK